jgi:FlgD Ig-like domain
MPEINRPYFQQGTAANPAALAVAKPDETRSDALTGPASRAPVGTLSIHRDKNATLSSFPGFGPVSSDLVWADVSRAMPDASTSDPKKKKAQSWDTLDVVMSNDFYKTVSTHFLFPRCAKPFFVKIIDLEGTLVREFNVSFPSAGPSFVRWNSKNINGRIVPPGDYMVKVLANNFEQAVRIVLEWK